MAYVVGIRAVLLVLSVSLTPDLPCFSAFGLLDDNDDCDDGADDPDDDAFTFNLIPPFAFESKDTFQNHYFLSMFS